MEYRRVYVRVPIEGEAQLSNDRGGLIKAETIDISQGGVALTDIADDLKKENYEIVISIPDGRRIELVGELVRQTDSIIGFKTLRISRQDLKVITDLVFQYQETTDFIKQIDEHNILTDRFVDEDGTELDVTFDVEPPKNPDRLEGILSEMMSDFQTED